MFGTNSCRHEGTAPETNNREVSGTDPEVSVLDDYTQERTDPDTYRHKLLSPDT